MRRCTFFFTLIASTGLVGHLEHHRALFLSSSGSPKLGSLWPHSQRRFCALTASAGFPGQLAHHRASLPGSPGGPKLGRLCPHSHLFFFMRPRGQEPCSRDPACVASVQALLLAAVPVSCRHGWPGAVWVGVSWAVGRRQALQDVGLAARKRKVGRCRTPPEPEPLLRPLCVWSGMRGAQQAGWHGWSDGGRGGPGGG